MGGGADYDPELDEPQAGSGKDYTCATCIYIRDECSRAKLIHNQGCYQWTDKLPSLEQNPTPKYYDHTFSGKKLDVYRVQLEMDITHPIQQHIHKKITRINKDNHKGVVETLNEIKQCCDRWLEMIEEDKE